MRAKTPQKRAVNHWEPVRESIKFHGECEHAAAVVAGAVQLYYHARM
jgi:hypothetical protein